MSLATSDLALPLVERWPPQFLETSLKDGAASMRGSLSKKTSTLPMTLVLCSCPAKKDFTKSLNIPNSTVIWPKFFLNFVSKSLLLLIGIYRSFGTQFLGGSCRFEPSCSEYAVEAVKTHSPSAAIRLIFFRLMKCHPWGSHGFDPVPKTYEVSR